MKTSLLIAAVLILIRCGADGSWDAPVVETREVLENAAAAGDAVAQFKLAVACQEGTGGSKDLARAVAWYRKSAAGGVTEAQYNLGVILSRGVDVPADLKEAARWFYAAAQSGFFPAQKAMIRIYLKGEGVEKSPAKALAWDLLARRTLELRYGASVGLPPNPATLRADGAIAAAGSVGDDWILPDGSRETRDETGTRHIAHKDGSKTKVWKTGAWESTYTNGMVESGAADGSRTLEQDGTNQAGEKVRIRDTFGPDGARTVHAVIRGDTTYEERADGSRVLESSVRREDGTPLILSEKVSKEGMASDGRLRRADNGEGPKGSEIWQIRRVLKPSKVELVDVLESYGEKGLIHQEVLHRRLAPTSLTTSVPVATPAGQVMTLPTTGIPLPLPMTQVLLGGARAKFDDPTAFAPKPDTTALMGELAQIEAAGRNFVGATAADFQRAQAGAAAYYIPLSIPPPQKAANTPAWLRERAISQTTLHEFALIPILDDRSKVVPFGPHGAELIKMYSWKHAETDHFIVHYTAEPEARLTVQYIEGAYVVLTQLLNLDPQAGPAKSHVFVLTQGQWKAYLSAKGMPEQLAGFAYKTELVLGEATDRQDRAESVKVLCHEVTHALVARFYGAQRPPLWLNEGLAEYIALRTLRGGLRAASNSPGDKKAASLANPAGDRTRLIGAPDAAMDVPSVFNRVRYGSRTSPDRLRAFYANSQKCLQVLFEKLPAEGFARFFNLVLAGNCPDTALAAVYGKQCESVAAFQRIVNGTGP